MNLRVTLLMMLCVSNITSSHCLPSATQPPLISQLSHLHSSLFHFETLLSIEIIALPTWLWNSNVILTSKCSEDTYICISHQSECSMQKALSFPGPCYGLSFVHVEFMIWKKYLNWGIIRYLLQSFRKKGKKATVAGREKWDFWKKGGLVNGIQCIREVHRESKECVVGNARTSSM